MSNFIPINLFKYIKLNHGNTHFLQMFNYFHHVKKYFKISIVTRKKP